MRRMTRSWKSIHSSGKCLGKLGGGPLPIRFYAAVSPYLFLSPYWEESSQTEEGPSLTLALMWLQSITQANAQLKWELANEMEGLARKYGDQQTRIAMKHRDWQARMGEEVDTTFWEVFSEASSTDLVRVLPWCISTTVNPGVIPTCYMSEALATTMQWRADAPVATTTPESEGWQAQASMSILACQTGTPPLPVLPMSDIPLISTPPVGCSFIRFIINPQH